MTFGKEPIQNKFGQGVKTKSQGTGLLYEESPAMILEEDEGEGKNNIKKIHTSTGKRKQAIKTE